jgi:hypothetical protein
MDAVDGLEYASIELGEVTHLEGVANTVRLDVVHAFLSRQTVESGHSEPVHVAHSTVPCLVVEVRRPGPTLDMQ